MDFTQLFTAFMTTSEYIFLPKRPDALKAFLRKKHQIESGLCYLIFCSYFVSNWTILDNEATPYPKIGEFLIYQQLS